MKKLIILFLLTSLGFGIAYSQPLRLNIVVDRKVRHDNYLITRTFWVIPSPFGFVSNRFSPDFGRTWKQVGMFGQGIKPYYDGNDQALQAINEYAAIRALGLAQLVASPILFIAGLQQAARYDASGPPYSPDDENTGNGFISASLISMITGYMTYHLIGRPSLKKSLAYYYANKESSYLIRSFPDLGLAYNPMTQSPMLSLRWTF